MMIMKYQIGDLIESKYLISASYPELIDDKELYIVYNFQTKQKCEYWEKEINYDWNCLRWAAIYGSLEIVKFLIENGANIHVWNDWTLRWAARNGHLEIVKYLVEKGANIHVMDERALHWAAENGHLEIVKYLVENGADIHAGNDYALCWAAERGHLKVVKYLQSLK